MMETRLRVQQKAAPPPSFTPARGGVLQRKCACGGTPGPTGECEACRQKKLQRAATHPASLSQGAYQLDAVPGPERCHNQPTGRSL